MTSQSHILIIDDDPTQLVLISTFLTNNNYKVTTVDSGDKALSFCRSHTPDLILLDLVMPDMDGIETCSRLKLLPLLKHTPIVVITGHTESERIIDSFEAGAIDFLTKPLDLLILSKKVEYILRNIVIDSRLDQKQQELFEVQKQARIGTVRINLDEQSIVLTTSCFYEMGFKNQDNVYSFSEFLDHIHDDDKDHVFHTLANTLKNNEDHILEYRFITDTNEELIFYQQCEFIEDIDNQTYYLFGSFQDVTKYRHVSDNLNYSLDHDKLTNLSNQNSFLKQVEHVLTSPPENSLFAVLFVGLDHFSLINDQYGHAGGDIALKTIATRLKKYEYDGHIVSRFSGDIFSLLLKNIKNIDDCNLILDQIMSFIKKPIKLDVNNIFLTASIGVSVFPLESDTSEQLLKSAEAAMMSSRHEGGDRYTYRTYDMNIETQRRLLVLKELRHALNRKQIHIYYQPQVDSINNTIIGMEALARWIHPDLGFISPDEFIPLAEETGLILQIGKHVLQIACEKTVHWKKLGFDLEISVNVSPYQFSDPDFLQMVISTLSESALPANKLKVEITESMAIKDPTHTIDILNKLRSMNIATSMDDFGTGHSSLSQLQTLPLDTLKVDQAFVRCISQETDSHDQTTYKNSAIASAIIVMAQSMGLNIVAEGVETQDQCQFLKGLNSTILQGYLFSRPLPADEFEELLISFEKKNSSHNSK